MTGITRKLLYNKYLRYLDGTLSRYVSRVRSAHVQRRAEGVCRSFDHEAHHRVVLPIRALEAGPHAASSVRAPPLTVFVTSEVRLVELATSSRSRRMVAGARSSFASVIRDTRRWFGRAVTGWQLTLP